MNPLLSQFRDCAHQVGQKCNVPVGKLIGAFGLADFLQNSIAQTDDSVAIAIKALDSWTSFATTLVSTRSFVLAY